MPIKKNISFYNYTGSPYTQKGILFTKYDDDNLYIAISIQQKSNIIPKQELIVEFDYDNNGDDSKGDFAIAAIMKESYDKCIYLFLRSNGTNFEKISDVVIDHVSALYNGSSITYEFKISFKEFNLEKKETMGIKIGFIDREVSQIVDFAFDDTTGPPFWPQPDFTKFIINKKPETSIIETLGLPIIVIGTIIGVLILLYIIKKH